MPASDNRKNSRRIQQQARECGCWTTKEPPRRINVEVTRCSMCPFMVRYDQEHAVQVNDEEGTQVHDGKVLKGWYCLHPAHRDSDEPISTHQAVQDSPDHVVGLDSWLRHHVGGFFPDFCPLTKPTVREQPTGERALNLGDN